MNKYFKIVLLLIVIAFATSLPLAGRLLLNIFQIQTTGKINAVGIAVYSDQAATQPLTSINWGELYAGASTTKQVYLVSLGNVPANLTLTSGNWNPPTAAQYLTVTWNYTAPTIQPQQKICVAFTLTVSNQIIDIESFSFTLNITATG